MNCPGVHLKNRIPKEMNRVLRAYQRDIMFNVFEKTIEFSIPIHTVKGDEYYILCSVLKDHPTDLKYEVIKTPMSLTIEMPEPANKIDGSFDIR